MIRRRGRIRLFRLTLAACVMLAALAAAAALAHAAGMPATSSLTLEWTTPGDDGAIGTADRYELRYSTQPITLDNFFQAALVVDLPHPATPGHHEKVTVRGLDPGVRYYFALRTLDDNGNWSGLSNVVKTTTPDPAVEPPRFPLAMSAPFPNPARDGVLLVLTLPEAAHVLVEVLDLSGRRVKTLVNGALPAGESPVRWSLEDTWGVRLPVGSYWVLGHVGDHRLTQRLTVLP